MLKVLDAGDGALMMIPVSFSNMVSISSAILWLVITCGLFYEFDALTASLASMACLYVIWRIAGMMASLAYGGSGGKALLVLWLVITGVYIGVFDSLVSLFLLACVGAVVWACFWHTMASRNSDSSPQQE